MTVFTAACNDDGFNRKDAENKLTTAIEAYCPVQVECDLFANNDLNRCISNEKEILRIAPETCVEDYFEYYQKYYEYQANDKDFCKHEKEESDEISKLMKPHSEKLYDCFYNAGRPKYGDSINNVEKLCKMSEFENDYNGCIKAIFSYPVQMYLCEREIISYYGNLADCAVEFSLSECREDEEIQKVEQDFEKCTNKYY